MKNYVHIGRLVEFTVPEGGATAGMPLRVGDEIVVPVVTAPQGESIACTTEGVFIWPKLPGVVKQGQRTYWKFPTPGAPENGITVKAEGNRWIGFAVEDRDTNDTEIRVKFNVFIT